MSAPFILDFSSSSGSKVAGMHKWHSHLRIRSDITGFVPPTINPEDDELTGFVPPVFEEDGLALLTVTRNGQDLPGDAVGLYHARINAEELETLRAAVEGTQWAQLPRPSGGDFNLPHLRIAYEREGLLIDRSFNAGNSEFIEAISPLWQRLDACLERAMKSAASTLQLSLTATPDEQDPLLLELELVLRARGIGHIVLNEPLLPPGPGHAPRLRLRVGQQLTDNPIARLANQTELPLPAPPEHAAPTMVLRPNRRVRIKLPWRAPEPGRYVFDAVWEDYAGPVAPAHGQTPFMPLPRTGPSALGSGPYPVRGALFAQARFELGPRD